MKKTEKIKKTSSVALSSLILALACIAYLIWKHWLFLAVGVVGFTLVITSKN